jgi:hypothetical protein
VVPDFLISPLKVSVTALTGFATVLRAAGEVRLNSVCARAGLAGETATSVPARRAAAAENRRFRVTGSR